MGANITRNRRTKLLAWVAVLAVVLASAACSPGSLPGSPSPLLSGGGGGRYDGTLTYRRVGGAFSINEAAQSLTMSLQLAAEDQFVAQFQSSGGSSGSLQGALNGTLSDGRFRATLLVTLPADTAAVRSVASIEKGSSRGIFGAPVGSVEPRVLVTCEGRGEVTGTFTGTRVDWSVGDIQHTGTCTGLVTSQTATATATSPIPSVNLGRANVIITVFPGTTIPEGTCLDGSRGFPFAIEVAETNGVAVTLDDTLEVEERRGTQVVRRFTEENPVRSLAAGERRRWSGCNDQAGTYQAFFTGTDANGNRIRFSSPIITFGSFTVQTVGVLTGRITNSANGQGISGATVSVGGVSATTNSSGNYTINEAPGGVQSVQSSASGFNTRTDTVNIAIGGTTNHSVALTPAGGTLTGTISNASNGQPISGARVAVGSVSATTDSSGRYTLSNAPAGSQTVTTSATGFTTRTDTVNVVAGSTTTFSTALVSTGTGSNVTIVLTWGSQPSDLDSHLVGPTPGGSRFHCFFGNPNPVSYVSLDVDDVTGFGPETITVSQSGGSFVAGSYSYYVHNFSTTPGWDVSQAVVTVFQSGAQLAQFRVSSASGSSTSPNWHVFNFTLNASGQASISSVQQLTSSAPTSVPLGLYRK
ncbi:MAG: carboxypeptidase-like regulatory domain-containing protein [Acidobacteria bacterium]|nr:carboxypeptidase-like regulatory domain-containing protein [Acidobacteriota bacterium]